MPNKNNAVQMGANHRTSILNNRSRATDSILPQGSVGGGCINCYRYDEAPMTTENKSWG